MRTRTFAFPFAFEQEQGFRNVGLTLAQYAEWYYRVRELELEIVSGDGNASGTIINLADVGSIGPPEDEQHIELYVGTHADGVGSGTLFYSINFNAVPWYDSEDDLYYIYVDIILTGEGGHVTTDPAQGPVAALTATFNGIEVPMYGSGFSGATVEITYSRWWEHRRANGSAPVTRESDGSLLRNPHQTDELP